MLRISDHIQIPEDEIEFSAIRSGGPGGQNVNKVSTAIHLRFNVPQSSLPDEVKARLLAMQDHRISSQGIIVIKSQRYRSQEKNRAEALERLRELVSKATTRRKRRKATKPTKASRQRRMDAKTRRGQTKALRRKPSE